MSLLESQPHRRWNPMTRRWILVSPHRTQRPWQGQTESNAAATLPAYDPGCYLCPGNARAAGERNPAYASTFVFANDYAALWPETEPLEMDDGGLLRSARERGICRVLIYSPDHGLTMSRMSQQQLLPVVSMWKEQTRDLARVEWVRSVMIFENRGAMMGASNPHPHGQVWANESVPCELALETGTQHEFWRKHGDTLLGRYAEKELAEGERIVSANEHYIALVPFWATWPFETMVFPRRRIGAITEQTPEEDAALSWILRDVTARFDNVFDAPFPYSMGLHQRPASADADGFHFHIHFLPPLLRSATVRKFLVGYELMAWPQRDITPESAANRLREVRGIPPGTH